MTPDFWTAALWGLAVVLVALGLPFDASAQLRADEALERRSVVGGARRGGCSAIGHGLDTSEPLRPAAAGLAAPARRCWRAGSFHGA